jgi:hypothetical protein
VIAIRIAKASALNADSALSEQGQASSSHVVVIVPLDEINMEGHAGLERKRL